MWRTVLLDLIARGRYSTQSQLVQALEECGQTVNQSSISRELRARHIEKLDGRYVLPIEAGLPDAVDLFDVRISQGGPLVVLRTVPAGAPILAQAIDHARIPGVIGTLAGDDTVFIACGADQDLSGLSRFLGRRLPAVQEVQS